MPLIDQALTTMNSMRLFLNMYTLTAVTSTETLITDTASTTFSFAHTDLAQNYFGTFYQIGVASATATASDSISTAVMTIDYLAGTTTFTATKTGVITVENYKYFAWDYSMDNLLERYINAASQMVSKYCNRLFIKDTYSEFYKGNGRQKLILRQYPVNQITSIKVDSAAFTAGTDYVTSDQSYLDQGIVFRNLGWTWYGYLTGLVGEPTAPVDNIEVVYSAGYTLSLEASKTLPWDLEDAVINIVANLHSQQQDRSVGLNRLTEGKLTFIYDNSPLIQRYAYVLDAYKRHIF